MTPLEMAPARKFGTASPKRTSCVRLAMVSAILAASLPAPVVTSADGPAHAPPITRSTLLIELSDIDEHKTVFATVRSRDRIEARVRITGTVTQLLVVEGREVAAGERVALVTDQKIALRLEALEAQIEGARSRLATARVEFDRTSELVRRGIAAQARYDQLKAAHDTAETDLKAAQSARAVAMRTIEEGEVLAPAAGRVLKVPVTVGTVVLPGESIATIAANAYLLRIEVPERHARFIGIGDPVRIGARGLAVDAGAIGEGRIVRVYPELQNGRVVADAEARGLAGYFVGERALVWISTGKRKGIVIPRSFVKTRFGFDYVRLARPAGDAIDIVVQLGAPAPLSGGVIGIEVLSGLSTGDRVLLP
jgi:RND family efflux transporter MFP subunit